MVYKISIITAYYNCRPWIGDAIRSVRDQCYPKYEHIILDDMSNDGGYRVLKKHSQKDANIKIIKPSDKLWCGGAYNVLAQEATGDIVCVLDADDVLASKAMEKISFLYEKYPKVGWIYTNFWFCNARMKKIKPGFSCHPGDKSLLEHGKHCFSHWRTYRREAVGETTIFKPGLRAAVDKYMGYKLEQTAIGGFTGEKLYKYRMRSGGLSYTGKPAWKKMKKRFTKKRLNNKIKVYPIKKLKMK